MTADTTTPTALDALATLEAERMIPVYLVELDAGSNCGWDGKQPGETPQCASIDIMEANKFGFRT